MSEIQKILYLNLVYLYLLQSKRQHLQRVWVCFVLFCFIFCDVCLTMLVTADPDSALEGKDFK